MSIEIGLLVLLAAAMHAGWNALIKVQGDRLAVMAVVTAPGSLISLSVLPFVEAPNPASWPLLALGVLLHVGYHVFLPRAYDHGDLGQIYPIARGSAPLLVALGAVSLAGESLDRAALLGVTCLAVGVMTLTFDKGAGVTRKPKAVLYALLTGTFIASYTVVDGLGVRRADSILGFAVWLTVSDGLLTLLLVSIWRTAAVRQVLRRSLAISVLGGALPVGAYWIIILALALAPMALVSSLRETRVLFAAIFSSFVLKEGFGVWRFISASLVTLGLVLGREK